MPGKLKELPFCASSLHLYILRWYWRQVVRQIDMLKERQAGRQTTKQSGRLRGIQELRGSEVKPAQVILLKIYTSFYCLYFLICSHPPMSIWQSDCLTTQPCLTVSKCNSLKTFWSVYMYICWTLTDICEQYIFRCSMGDVLLCVVCTHVCVYNGVCVSM